MTPRGAVARPEVGLRLGLELLEVRPVGGNLPGDALDQAPVLFEPPAPFLQLLNGAVVLVAHLRDGVRLPEEVRHLVDLRHERRPELVENHGDSFRIVYTSATS